MTLGTGANRVLRERSREVRAALNWANHELIIRETSLLKDNHNRGKGSVTIVVEAGR